MGRNKSLLTCLEAGEKCFELSTEVDVKDCLFEVNRGRLSISFSDRFPSWVADVSLWFSNGAECTKNWWCALISLHSASSTAPSVAFTFTCAIGNGTSSVRSGNGVYKYSLALALGVCCGSHSCVCYYRK